MTKIMLDGLTTKPLTNLLQVAKSWLSPPKVEVKGKGFETKGYDPAQGAFILARDGMEKSSSLQLILEANESSPLYDPAIVVKDWGDANASLKVNGNPATLGKDFRIGHIHRLQGTDLVIWLRMTSTHPIRLLLSWSHP